MTAHISDAVASFRETYDPAMLVHAHNHPASAGQRITHLAVDPVLSHAWINLTGEPFRPHHAAALMAMRRQEHVAIVSANPRRTLSLICMTINVLLESPTQRALLVVHDEVAAMALYREIVAFVEKFSHDTAIMPVIVTDTTGAMVSERLLIVTYDALHRRLLGHHDRAWRSVWQSLAICGIIDLHTIAGIGMYHLGALLKRIQRVVHQYSDTLHLQYMTTLVPATAIDSALDDLAIGSWKVVYANDYAYESTTVEIWQRPDNAIQVAQALAHELSAQGYAAHIWARDTLQPLLDPIDMHSNVTGASRFWSAQVLIMVGVADDRWRIAEALQSGYTMIVLVLGVHPLDQWYAQHPAQLLDLTPLAWPAAALNAYVLTQHVRAAACEIPFTDDEFRLWYASELRDRLVERGQLMELPDLRWSVAGDDNVYDDFHMLSAIGLPVLMQLGDMTIDTPFDPTGFERWLAKGSSAPPWYGGLRVIQRNDDDAIVTLQPDVQERRTMPLRSSTVAIRDSKETVMLARGILATYGRVLVTESVEGVREIRDGVVKDHTLTHALESRWSAHAWWIDIPTYVHTDAQTIGWSVILALPVLSLFTTSAAVPCADLQFGRLYFVDAQPGGNGASEWMFRHVDALLQTALSIAKVMQHDVMYTQSATNDVAWLELITPAPVRQTASQPIVQPIPDDDPTEGDDATTADEVSPTYPVVIPGLSPASHTDVTVPQPVVPPSSSSSAIERRIVQPRGRRERPLIPEVPTPVMPRPSVSSRVNTPTVKPAQPLITNQTNPTPQTPVSRETPPATKAPSSQSRVSGSRVSRDTSSERSPHEPVGGDSGVPNVNRIMANLRKQIQQKLPTSGTQIPTQSATTRSQDEIHRFTPGQRIFCLPYGDGEIVESFFVDGREFIRVDFPNYGELKIDPSLSLVKILSDADDTNTDD
ncbi:MAG: hypothetical protein ACO3F2_05705 [Roseiflexaceae bacterium]